MATHVAAGVALSPRRGPGFASRHPITARALMDAICLDGRDMKSILSAAGWSGHQRDTATLIVCAEECLEAMAQALGIVPATTRAQSEEITASQRADQQQQP
ncbi:MAG: hypothetical protein ABJH07_19615 [Sedimentitalea sp.]|uniref:hypothetical protein n=1 Tax=Sedimentitalea sp. TaxID=2048915 RepID=UPI003267AF96